MFTHSVNTIFSSVINKEIEVVNDIYYLNVSLFKKKTQVEGVCFAFSLSETMPYLQPGGTPVRDADQ